MFLLCNFIKLNFRFFYWLDQGQKAFIY